MDTEDLAAKIFAEVAAARFSDAQAKAARFAPEVAELCFDWAEAFAKAADKRRDGGPNLGE